MPKTLGDIAMPARIISASARLQKAISAFMQDDGCKAFVVAEAGKLTGILTRARAMEMAAGAGSGAIESVCVGDVIVDTPQRVDAKTSIAKFAFAQLTRNTGFSNTGYLVIKNGKFLGLIYPSDLLAELARENAVRAKSIKALKTKVATPAQKDAPNLDMLSTLAHEIRTPLTGMMGLAEMLAARKLDTESRKIAETIRQSGQALDRIVTDTLDFGRLGAGKLKLNVEPADLSDLANELRNLWAPQSRRRGLSLMIGLSPDVPSLIKVDTGRVRQIANNLISNALKFTSRGGVTVSIAVHPVAGRTMLSVEVADTGTGIPDKDKTRLFKAFETGAEPGERLPGWGLGLSISNALAKHLDGSLSVADNPAGGAVFTLLVPVEKARPAELVGGERLKSGRFALGEALLIEDHEPSAFIVTDALTTAGWSVVRAKSLSAARKMTGAKRFQVILTDLHLIDGHAGPFVETLRAGSGLNKTQPIAAITADVSGSVEQVCRAQGFDRVIRKPVQGPALVANLADLLMSHAAGKISRPALRGRLAS